MMFGNLLHKLRNNSPIFALLLSLCLLVAIGITSIDWKSAFNENPSNTAQALDTATPNNASTGNKGSGFSFKRMVTAPVRLIAKLFHHDETPVVAAIPAPASKTDTSLTTAIEREAASTFDQAVELHEKKQIDEAIAKLTAVVGMQPNNSEAYNLLGVCYDEKGKYSEAQNEYKKAIKLEPINARFLNNLGYSYYLNGNDKQAIKWYQRALKFTPGDNRLQNNLGLAYGRKGEYAKAKEQFVKSVGEVGALLNMGYLYNQQGYYQQAIAQFEAALKLEPNSLVAINSLAQVYDRVGRVRDSQILFAQYKKLSNSTAGHSDQTAERKNDQQEKEEQ